MEAELEELEGQELEEQLLQPVPFHVPQGNKPTRLPAQKQPTAEEDELAALQAEMAL